MKNITILVPEGAVLASIADPRYMFTAANEMLRNSGKKEMFIVKLASLYSDVTLSDGTATIHPDAAISEIKKTDLVIIPALGRDVVKAIEMNKELIPWIIEQYKNGAEVASLCIGAFLFASTGLLKGEQCSTHWLYAAQIQAVPRC